MIAIYIIIFLVSLLLTIFFRDIFSYFNIVDRPDNLRKKHEAPTPFGGGLSIIITTLLFIWLIEVNTGFFTSGLITNNHLISFTIASIWIAIIGLLDDIFTLKPKYSLFGPLGAAIIITASNFSISEVTNPAGGIIEISPLISSLIIFVWLLLLMFSLKFLDGVDGLSSGTAMIGSTMIIALTSTTAFFQPDVQLMASIVSLSILGFFIINLSKNKVYLGEVGSVWLGFVLAILSIISGSKLLTILTVLSLPILDAIFVILRRLRLKKSIFKGDRLHLHHFLFDRGWSKYKILTLYLSAALLLGLSSLLLSGWYKWVLFIVVLLILTIEYIFEYAKKI